MAELIMRPAQATDLDALGAILPVLDGGQNLLTPDALHATLTTITQHPNQTCYVATLDEVLVGALLLFVVQQFSHGGGKSLIVEDLMVHPDYQGQGVGQGMMRFAARYGQMQGCYKINLCSNKARDIAHEFYRKLGYEQHGISFLLPLR